MAKVVIFGDSHWASLAYIFLKHDSPHEVVAFTVDRDYLKESELFGLPVVAFDDVEKLYPPDEFKMFLPISYKRMNHLRADKYNQAKDMGYRLISYVSSKTTTWPDFVCGDNCFIFADNHIQPFVQIGNDVIICPGNVIAHHTIIKDHVFMSPNVVILGCCSIEPHCFFGASSTVRDETCIAKETLVGAGTLILEDTKEYEVYIAKKTEPAGIRSDEMRSISHKAAG